MIKESDWGVDVGVSSARESPANTLESFVTTAGGAALSGPLSGGGA